MKDCRRVGNPFRFALIVAISALCLGGNAYGSGAKALFYDEGDVSLRTEVAAKVPATKKRSTRKAGPAAARRYPGISYWIELLDRQGRYVRTTTSRVFHSGDRIKLNLRSNRNGYLYVVGLGSSGTSRVLFPDSEHVANGIKANVTYAVPFGGNLRFDDRPGEEKILILLSRDPIPQLGWGRRLPSDETRQLVASAHVPGAKDLVLEEVPETAAEPASYAVIPVSTLWEKRPLTLEIKLKHR